MPSLVEIVERTQNGERRGDDHHDVNENAERVGADQIAVGRAGIARHEAHGSERDERADKADPAQDALVAPRCDERDRRT